MIHFNIKLSSTLRSFQQFLSFRISHKIPYAFLKYFMHVTCPIHVILLSLIILINGLEYKSWHPSLHNCPQPPGILLPLTEPQTLLINWSLLQWLAAEGADNWSVTGLQALVHEPLIQLNSLTVGTERITNYMIHGTSKATLWFSLLLSGACQESHVRFASSYFGSVPLRTQRNFCSEWYILVLHWDIWGSHGGVQSTRYHILEDSNHQSYTFSVYIRYRDKCKFCCFT